jgi:hypothetical protein
MATTPAVLSGATYTVKLNGTDLHAYGVLSYAVPNLGMAPLETVFESFPERHEAYAFSASFQPRPFVITGAILADSVSQLRSNLDLLKYNQTSLRGSQYTIPTPIRIEFADQTDRYYPCHYQSFEVRSYGQFPTGERHVQFALNLIQLTPFAIAATPTEAAPSGTGPSFTVLDTGTAPCPCIVELEGAATAPDFVLADMSFYWKPDWTMNATVIDGTTNTGTCGATPASDQFEPGEYGGRYIQDLNSNTFWDGVIANNAEGTILLGVRPYVAWDSTGGQWLLDWIDALSTNYLLLYYDTATDKFKFAKYNSAGALETIGANADEETFAADTKMIFALSFGAAGMKLYKDAVILDSDATVTDGVSITSASMYFGSGAGTNRAPYKYDFLYWFPFQLSDDDVKRFSLNPGLVRPHNIKKSKTGNLAANERSILNFENYNIEKLSTALSLTNDWGDWDANGMPLLRPNQMCFYVPSGESIGGIKVLYHKRYL